MNNLVTFKENIDNNPSKIQNNLHIVASDNQLQFDSLSKIQNISQEDCMLYSVIYGKINEMTSLFQEVLNDNDFRINYKIFNQRLWVILNEIHSETSNIELNRLKKLQLLFRGALLGFFNDSLILSRALAKPYGYPGDYIMLQTLYDNRPVSKSRLGQYLDQFFLDDELAKAVINRVEVMGDRVVKFIEDSDKEEINILNIASGSGFELKKIISRNYSKKIIYHCFDQEVSSLCYISQNFLGKNDNVIIKLYKEDIRKFFRNWSIKSGFDFIYNIGLADYLPDKILTSLISESLNSLNDNGVFILAHKNYKLFPYHHPSWLYDWNFIHRSLDDYQKLLASKIDEDYSIWFESNKKVVYFSEFMNVKK